jgi:4-diphosphocytidyl-2-C-methyl-D-erythritol kinase
MDGMVRCTGRGEIVQPVAADPPGWPVLVLKPQFSVATLDAYRRWSESAEIAGLNYRPQVLDGFTLRNDLERPVFAKHRFLGELKGWLLDRDETRAALLCGSGSSMFAVLHEGADATELVRAARHELDPTLWHWFGRINA